jgi:putative tryptophan/tyrosine transport system substrate-binding protein
MKRREFTAGLCGTVAWPIVARAQQRVRVRRVGVLMATGENDSEVKAWLSGFLQGLAELGWTDGRDLRMDFRWASGKGDLASLYAKELVALRPDVIFAASTAVTAALARETRTIPIVFVVVSEPVAQSFVASLAHPGGNITGFTNLESTVGAKWLGLLMQIAPSVTRVGVMFNPQTAPIAAAFSRSVESAAPRFGVQVVAMPVRETAEIESMITTVGREVGGGLILPPDNFTTTNRRSILDLARYVNDVKSAAAATGQSIHIAKAIAEGDFRNAFATFAELHAGALIIGPDPFFFRWSDQLIALAARYAIPAIYEAREYTKIGGLMSYGANIMEAYRQAGIYVGQILKGAKPADLPVQLPTKFDFVINLKTAKTLGLDVPPNLLALADEIIE